MLRPPASSQEEQSQCHVRSHVAAVVHLRMTHPGMESAYQPQHLQVARTTHGLRGGEGRGGEGRGGERRGGKTDAEKGIKISSTHHRQS